jgi:hypothetical protein
MTELTKFLAEVAEREKKATPGPWSVPHLSSDEAECNCPYILCEGLMGSVADVSVDNGLKVGEGGNDSPPLEEAKANGVFIAHARQDIPKLLRLVEVLLDLAVHVTECPIVSDWGEDDAECNCSTGVALRAAISGEKA